MYITITIKNFLQEGNDNVEVRKFIEILDTRPRQEIDHEKKNYKSIKIVFRCMTDRKLNQLYIYSSC